MTKQARQIAHWRKVADKARGRWLDTFADLGGHKVKRKRMVAAFNAYLATLTVLERIVDGDMQGVR